ncbi:nicotinate-nucleotide--dimethylbenzimidazole phosphoribosyltransferase [Oceanobacter mangrovi]|uniref:nicotinate-nucleotide--dimethylbenzimidazole phosphoribosyltransferase n=1 Tax=Oceanobacter mangrovi TaxID=2862510 RepID=UPI001C8E8BC9
MIYDFPVYEIKTLDDNCRKLAQQRIDNKTKPPGSLGKLEGLAALLAQMQAEVACQPPQAIQIKQPTMLVFAADHGIARQPVSIAPQAVTGQMVLNYLNNGAAINCFCASNDMALEIVDMGMVEPVADVSGKLVSARAGAGTEDFSVQPAMTFEQLLAALESGNQIARKHIRNGSNLLAFGEMGIGNTTSAAALLVLLEDLSVVQAVGRGTGISDEQLQLKTDLVRQAVERVRATHRVVSSQVAMMEVGGFEIVAMVGAMLTAAERGCSILVDGFIVSIAALLAVRIEPSSRDYMIFAHRSAELAHELTLRALAADPLLDLGLRLGEGTGAALALPLLRCACAFYNDMATFESAGVTV